MACFGTAPLRFQTTILLADLPNFPTAAVHPVECDLIFVGLCLFQKSESGSLKSNMAIKPFFADSDYAYHIQSRITLPPQFISWSVHEAMYFLHCPLTILQEIKLLLFSVICTLLTKHSFKYFRKLAMWLSRQTTYSSRWSFNFLFFHSTCSCFLSAISVSNLGRLAQ